METNISEVSSDLPDYTALGPRSVIDVHKGNSISVIINILKFVQQRRKIYPISAV